MESSRTESRGQLLVRLSNERNEQRHLPGPSNANQLKVAPPATALLTLLRENQDSPLPELSTNEAAAFVETPSTTLPGNGNENKRETRHRGAKRRYEDSFEAEDSLSSSECGSLYTPDVRDLSEDERASFLAESGEINKEQDDFTVVNADEMQTVELGLTPGTSSNSENITQPATPTVQPTKKKARKGQGDAGKWIRNKNKILRMKGEQYSGLKKDASGRYKQTNPRKPREMGPNCKSKRCEKSKKRQCASFSEEDRIQIFSAFWKKMDWAQRKVYASALIDHKDIAQKTVAGNSRRSSSFEYHLKTAAGERKRVCKKMYLNTLALVDMTVNDWVKKGKPNCGMHETDAGKKTPNRISNKNKEAREKAKTYLQTLQKLPSHYCRSSTSKQYLEPIFTTQADVYRAYELYCKEKGDAAVCRQVFMEEFHKLNLSVFHPRKDQCDKCCEYKTGNLTEEVYQNHLVRKNEARDEKVKDKKAALEGSVRAFTMDVQAVQLVPHLKASAVYFKTKLACHNYTVYDLASQEVVCYIWHEGEGELIAEVFASFILDFLHTCPLDKEIIFFTDGCNYQNRNATLSNALLHFAIANKVVVTHKYLEVGHTQMECDSVHSTIETRKVGRELYSPTCYVQVCKEACFKKPYNVKYITHEFFKNYAPLKYYASIRPGFKKGDPVVTDIRALQYRPEGEIHYKLFHNDLKLLPKRPQGGFTEEMIKPLYTGRLKIRSSKYKHLQELKSVITSHFHKFYDELPHSADRD